MGRTCTWCSADIELPASGRHGGRSMTEALCTECSEHFVFQMGVPLQAFLDSLPAPIFVVDDDVIVKAANNKGYDLLKKGPDQIRGRLGGVVFECAYARLPEGCGRTVHCSACTIRRSVYYTYETGKSLTEVPATLKWQDQKSGMEIAMLISTEKMGNVVLLRIDRIETLKR